MKILVIGASGLIGSHVLRSGQTAGHTVFGTYRRLRSSGLEPLDCADQDATRSLLDACAPDAVIHAAGWSWVDGCEDDPGRAREENALQPEKLAQLCQAAGVYFAYFSTSYIFDGKEGPYSEEDCPNPINAYSRSKWEGEQRVQAVFGGAALIPRIVGAYGPEPQRKNFAYQVWRALKEGGTIRLPSDQVCNPTFAGDIGRWLITLVEKRAVGVWNVASSVTDWARPHWAKELVRAFSALGIPSRSTFRIQELPTAVLKQRALRPLNSAMLTTKLETLGLPSTGLPQAVAEIVERDRQFAFL